MKSSCLLCVLAGERDKRNSKDGSATQADALPDAKSQPDLLQAGSRRRLPTRRHTFAGTATDFCDTFDRAPSMLSTKRSAGKIHVQHLLKRSRHDTCWYKVCQLSIIFLVPGILAQDVHSMLDLPAFFLVACLLACLLAC